MGRPRSVSGAVPATLTMNGTVGAPLIDAVVRAHGSSQVSAQPSKAMPMGPVTAHMSNATRTSPLRQDIDVIIALACRRFPSDNENNLVAPTGFVRWWDTSRSRFLVGRFV
jgi:hypothetical protein